jgi:hypothetical protein
MATRSCFIGVADLREGIDLHTLVSEPDVLLEASNQHAGEVAILYRAPTAGQLAELALVGGTGTLEDYGHDSDIKQVHPRAQSRGLPQPEGCL